MELFRNSKEKRWFQVTSTQQGLLILRVKAHLGPSSEQPLEWGGRGVEAAFLLESVRTFPWATPIPDPHEDKGEKSGLEVLPEG